MTIIEERLVELENLSLAYGGHGSVEEGLCIMEAVAYVAGEPHSDHPKCASPILTAFCMQWNDRLNDDDRQLLKPFIPRLVGTNTGAADELTRKWMMLDWLVHEYAPAVFRATGAVEQAEQFEGLVAITGSAEWVAARDTIYKVRDEAWERRRVAAAVAVAVAVAVADADADAAADAAADAVAAAVAVAVADAAADAVAAAVAVAVADAAAAAVAAAVAAAPHKEAAEAAAKAGADYWDQRQAAYRVYKPYYDKVWAERFVEITPGLRQSALGLLERLIEVGR